MALARQPMPEVRSGPIQWNSHRLLLIVAGAIAILCGCGAFLLLVMRDHGHANVMVNEQSSPTLLTKSAPAASRVSEASKAADAGKASPMVKPAEAVNPTAANTPQTVQPREVEPENCAWAVEAARDEHRSGQEYIRCERVRRPAQLFAPRCEGERAVVDRFKSRGGCDRAGGYFD